MAAPNPTHIAHGSSKAELEATLIEKRKQLEEFLSSSGWTAIASPGEGITFESKTYPNCPISAYRASGLVEGDPKKLADYCWNMSLSDWQRQDPNIILKDLVEQVSPDLQIWKQNNKLPWPIWARSNIFAIARETRADGSTWIYGWSVNHPTAKVDETNFVHAYLHLAAWGFVPKDGKTMVHRVLQVDPAGNLPTMVVEVSANNMVPACIVDWRKNAPKK